MKVLLIIILVILAIRVLRKNIYFSVYSDLSRKMNKEQNRYREETRKREGQVTIDTSQSASKNKDKDDGEYVDYTEIK
ncbi:MAG TPA: hypothetical protein VJY62_17840 [Bacteroidia bacterium]|nr:hypothetical protein [Bacteroidia bacterium]